MSVFDDDDTFEGEEETPEYVSAIDYDQYPFVVTVGDKVEAKVSQEITINGRKVWVTSGLVSQALPGEDAEDATARVREIVLSNYFVIEQEFADRIDARIIEHQSNKQIEGK